MKVIKKTSVWVPAWPGGFLLFLLLIAALGYAAAGRLYPFLSKNRPLPDAELAVMEGWLDDAELRIAAESLLPGQRVICAGGPIEFGQKLLGYENYAELCAARLALMGVPEEMIIIAPAAAVHRDRTYAAALAVREKLEELNLSGTPANLYTFGAHGRRSFLLFQKALGSDYPLGVISVSPEEYELDRWYLHSQGFKHVLGEFLAWIYTKGFVLFND